MSRWNLHSELLISATQIMKRISISLILLLFASFALYGQFLPTQVETQDVTLTKEYKAAKSTFIGGLVIAGVGTLANLAGNAICVIEQNRYTNSHTSSGSVDEILRLNQEAKQQPAYKKGQVWEIAGFAGILVGGGISWYGGSKMRKIRNSNGNTFAIIDYGINPFEISLAVSF